MKRFDIKEILEITRRFYVFFFLDIGVGLDLVFNSLLNFKRRGTKI